MTLNTRLRTLAEDLGTSYWFVPTLMALAAIGLAFLTLALDRSLNRGWVSDVGLFYSGSAEGARLLLSTVASSMITVAGVVFSITIVALTLASSQFGPHILRGFMRDVGSKLVLGTFISTYIYCLLVLRTVRGEAGATFVPNISVTVGVALAIAGLGMIIYFIHHTATLIQADSIIAAIGDDLSDSIKVLFPEPLGIGGDPPAGEPEPPPASEGDASAVSAARAGYIQAVDAGALLALAREGDLFVRMLLRPGRFVTPGCPLMQVSPAARLDERLAERLRRTVFIGSRRTPVQDLEFALQQLAQMAVRALSPGINDPYTAMRCIDQLCEGLCLLASRALPHPCRYDAEGRMRIVAAPPTFDDALVASLDQIRPYSGSSLIAARLLNAIRLIARHLRREDDRGALRRQARRVEEQTLLAAQTQDDREQVQRGLREALAALEPRR